MASHEQRIVQFLLQPSSYPHAAAPVERRETHVSHVFLAGPFAYKVKKPVKFPFVDASTLAQRRKFCRLELTLNRRLAPTVYLGMVPIVETAKGLAFGSPSTRPGGLARDVASRDIPARLQGRVVEWAVKMRRLPEQRMLDRLVARRRVTRRDMAAIADRLLPFFAKAGRGPRIDRFGWPASVRQLVLGNLEECRPFIGALLSESDRRLLEAAYRQFLALQEPVLEQRLREHRIIDGHGDLRCENICLADGVQVFDCVEFEPAFRCGDIANDFSFLVMDLESRGRPDLAAALAGRYRARLADPTFPAVLPFYKCHRSLVRGKVRGFAWQQHPGTAEGRRLRGIARGHFRLAVEYARAFAPPRLIVVGGLIGSGKSTLARGLAERLGAVWLRSDEIRLTEFAGARRARQGFGEGLYAAGVSAQVYERLIRRAGAAVARGQSVVCDGTFSKHAGRERLRRTAGRLGASFHFIECAVPKAVALWRIAKRRAARSDISEARPEHYERLKAGFEPVRRWPASAWSRVSDNRAAHDTLEAALSALRRAWGNT